MMLRILAIAAFAGVPFITVEAKTMVLIGDSMSEYAKNTAQEFCGGAVATNKGIGGTTAQQWQTQDDDSDMYVPNAVKDKAGNCFDVVFVSLGGNDQLTTGCAKSLLSTVQSRIASVLTQIKTVCPNSEIFMTGYPTPAPSFTECSIPVTGKGTREHLNDPVKAACEANSACSYHEATNLFGSTDSTESSGAYHVDNIHLNRKGYCVLWGQDSFRTMVGCTGAKTDCSTVEGSTVAPPEVNIDPNWDALAEGNAMAAVALSAMGVATLAL